MDDADRVLVGLLVTHLDPSEAAARAMDTAVLPTFSVFVLMAARVAAMRFRQPQTLQPQRLLKSQ